MARLYTYCIPVDDGAAPNPFGGVCTLAICKPAIRRTASIGDWVVGTGSKRSPAGDLSGRVVYAMRVTRILAMEDYDRWASKYLPIKIPDFHSADNTRRLGDSIYVPSGNGLRQRQGVHGSDDQKRDLSGKNVLLSEHFYYFGADAVPLPQDLLAIVQQTQGHRVHKNAPYLEKFAGWIAGYCLPGIHGRPATILATAASRLRSRRIRNLDERFCGISTCSTGRHPVRAARCSRC